MRHGKKGEKFKFGYDAKRALVRKLVRNFILQGKITTTHKRARALRSQIERLVQHAKKNTESSKNVLLRHTGDRKLTSLLITQIAPFFKDRVSGFVKLTKLLPRAHDSADIVRLEWITAVVINEEKPEKKLPKKKAAVKKK